MVGKKVVLANDGLSINLEKCEDLGPSSGVRVFVFELFVVLLYYITLTRLDTLF